ncbi:hypothetical protein ID858_07950 [Xenorhabdus sp. DI]|uniref:hypothetical protein n=1 Tax=Xenorhabdus doucetiae TaxID=351671 RepID=UPI0019C93650|nr:MULTISPECIES: hypothetical protein [unclassified Xenorhabdus]MBD2785416.1 hypothetical protein [Xenorhabdus sp. 3]MBD2788440.1 hypothetical protein [Xenorhabdus sp. DI]
MAITLTTQQILYINNFLDIEFTQPDPSELSTEITIMNDMELKEDGEYYKGKGGVFFTEYPEEGAMALEGE